MNDDTSEKLKTLLEYGGKLNEIVVKAQAILAEHIEPGGLTKEHAINSLLGLLDGPEQREAQAGWNAAISKR